MIWIALLIFLYLLIHTYLCNRDIVCLSDIAYDKHKWVFIGSLWAMVFLMLPLLFTVTAINWQFIVFLLGISMLGISITPYKNKYNYKIHVTCAIISMLSIIALWTIKGYWFIPLFFLLAGLREKWLLGVEISLISSAFCYCLI